MVVAGSGQVAEGEMSLQLVKLQVKGVKGKRSAPCPPWGRTSAECSKGGEVSLELVKLLINNCGQ